MPKAQLDLIASVLRDRYVSHEMTADAYASAMEDIKLCGHAQLAHMAGRLL